jgi:hypothetical protein
VRNDFEAATAHLPPYDPAQNELVDHSGGKRGSADIGLARRQTFPLLAQKREPDLVEFLCNTMPRQSMHSWTGHKRMSFVNRRKVNPKEPKKKGKTSLTEPRPLLCLLSRRRLRRK